MRGTRKLLFAALLFFAGGLFSLAIAATNIDPAFPFTWNDLIGWIDFYATGATSDGVIVTSNVIQGSASSSAGYISLDCATSPNGNICPLGQADPRFYRVRNDRCGVLDGYAWNDALGWISFNNSNHGGSIPYGVTISPTTGHFNGYAWNDLIGWISFCNGTPGCTNNPQAFTYGVRATWTTVAATGTLDATVYDTGVPSAQLNSFIWQGGSVGTAGSCGGTGTRVDIQFASGDSTSSLSFIGPDGSSNTFYGASTPNTSVPLNSEFHRGRYFSYRVTLRSDPSQRVSPRLDDVIVNWSP